MKAVITSGGLGTRLLPSTKEIPKELLPLYDVEEGEVVMKPVLQIIFETLYEAGIREFCIVTGRGKRAVEDHFTPDWNFVEYLEANGKESKARSLRKFFEMIESSIIIWVKQSKPLGFGHAVYMAKPFVDDEPFLLAAGDTVIYPRRFISSLLSGEGDARMVLKHVKDPRRFGVAVLEGSRVVKVVEKPENPPSSLVILPYYVLPPEIMEYLAQGKRGYGNEIQLTDGIDYLISSGLDVRATVLGDEFVFADVGTPESYFEALMISRRSTGDEV